MKTSTLPTWMTGGEAINPEMNMLYAEGEDDEADELESYWLSGGNVTPMRRGSDSSFDA